MLKESSNLGGGNLDTLSLSVVLISMWETEDKNNRKHYIRGREW